MYNINKVIKMCPIIKNLVSLLEISSQLSILYMNVIQLIVHAKEKWLSALVMAMSNPVLLKHSQQTFIIW